MNTNIYIYINKGISTDRGVRLITGILFVFRGASNFTLSMKGNLHGHRKKRIVVLS